MTPPRRLRADARQNRDRILDVAEKAFATRGLSVQITEIAQEAGVGVGTIYRHFPTKEELFEAIVVARVQHLIDRARELASAPDPGEAFFGFFAHVIEQAMRNAALYQTLSQAAGFDMSGLGQDLVKAEGTLLRNAQKAGAVRTDIDVHDLKAIVSGCLAMEGQAESAARPRRRGRLAAIVCDGLRPR